MPPKLYGPEHITYIIISTIIGIAILFFTKKFTKSEKSQVIILKCVAGCLLLSILANRLSQVFRYDTVRWYTIIPDSFCGMSSLVLALAVLLGKKDNNVYHFVWLLALFGGISTIVYPTFVDQGATLFYLPTISGLLHHSFSALTVIMALMLKQINITYKKWYTVVLGFTCYLTVGAFLMSVFNMSDAFHIVEPLLPNTSLTVWVMALIYLPAHALIFAIIEIIRKHLKTKTTKITE